MSDQHIPSLYYTEASKSAVPLLAHEQHLQTVTAEPWIKISDEGLQLEGLCFDRNHNLFLCEVFGGTIFRIDLPEKKLIQYLNLRKLTRLLLKYIKTDDYICLI